MAGNCTPQNPDGSKQNQLPPIRKVERIPRRIKKDGTKKSG